MSSIDLLVPRYNLHFNLESQMSVQFYSIKKI